MGSPFFRNHPSMSASSICRAIFAAWLGMVIMAGPVLAQPKGKRGKEAPSKSGVADYHSKNFIVRTDLPPDEAKDLLKRLEAMLALVEKYYEHKLPSVIGMIVVKDLKAWPREILQQFDPMAINSLQTGGGVTLSQTLRSGSTGQIMDAKAIVYAVADRGTPQHEAVHAYCILTFGRTGPIWYAEGMAEIGQYWTDKGLGVHCHEIVLEYLQSERPKQLADIVDTSDRSGDSWQNYAWRWVLCHMLANNPNYAPRFKPLGLGLLNGQSVSFQSVYGSMEQEINFEYQFFLRHIDDGYRADLCAWDWKAKYPPCRGSSPFSTKIDAVRGWQPGRVTVEANIEYDYAASGTWKTNAKSEPVDANGAADGTGRLEGAIFDDYQLSEPFPLGAYGTFIPPQSGYLMLRCQDKWNELADNSGKMQVKIKLSGKGNPLPDPTKVEAKTAAASSTSKADKRPKSAK